MASNKFAIVAILVVLLCSVYPTHAQQDCSFTHGDRYWDLSPLKKEDGEGDWYIPFEMYNFYINICGNTEPNEFCATPNPAYYYLWFGTCIICGNLNKMQWALINPSDPAVGPSLTYLTSDVCASGLQDNNTHVLAYRQIVMNFWCKENVEGTPYQLSNPTGCSTVIDFETMYGCSKAAPKIGGLSGGSILLIILLVLVVVYIVGGFVFNVKYKGQALGVDAFPHLEFWSTIPGLVKDGAIFTYHKIQALRS